MEANGRYILDEDGNPQLEPDLFRWAMWLEYSHRSKGKDNRIVQQDYVGVVHVSTVFLGLAFGSEQGRPLLWETMIFGGEHDSYQRRYTSRADAEAGHKEALGLVIGLRDAIAELERMITISGGWEKK